MKTAKQLIEEIVETIDLKHKIEQALLTSTHDIDTSPEEIIKHGGIWHNIGEIGEVYGYKIMQQYDSSTGETWYVVIKPKVRSGVSGYSKTELCRICKVNDVIPGKHVCASCM